MYGESNQTRDAHSDVLGRGQEFVDRCDEACGARLRLTEAKLGGFNDQPQLSAITWVRWKRSLSMAEFTSPDLQVVTLIRLAKMNVLFLRIYDHRRRLNRYIQVLGARDRQGV